MRCELTFESGGLKSVRGGNTFSFHQLPPKCRGQKTPRGKRKHLQKNAHPPERGVRLQLKRSGPLSLLSARAWVRSPTRRRRSSAMTMLPGPGRTPTPTKNRMQRKVARPPRRHHRTTTTTARMVRSKTTRRRSSIRSSKLTEVGAHPIIFLS